jgi:hypothetical protein
MLTPAETENKTPKDKAETDAIENIRFIKINSL